MTAKPAIFKIDTPEVVEKYFNSQVLVLPTDTLYGLSARAGDQQAVYTLYALKNRTAKPGTVIAASIDQLVELGIKRRYLSAVADYWPGPLSVEIPHSLNYLSQGTGRQAFRIVADSSLVRLLKKTGPLLTTSCNPPGQMPAINISQAISYFGDKVAGYIDGGDLSARQPSTLIRIVDDAIEIIREGAVKI